ncbi:MAG: COG3178: Predicted phosphotransferase related to Ser/Thr protein kinases [uncultured Sulfurovum sp.]|uniref:COG3178: Predicted phosphotransferase related to Ser/Thr protein kinases n=1 Tax=uncultured Sulfurovum sp. TaxID=269237 RepID=A0A6S6TYS9_9BACT|nr:MAG: COG3178: Predicted phosphotransferase related to Ser/Thr protein kinases [uncultured Sulfurovum sp.]
MHNELKGWLEWLGMEEPKLTTLHGDASTRSYYRLENHNGGIVMDASENKESVPIFIGMSMRLNDAKVRIPKIKSFELHKGFMFLEDIGSTHLLDKCVEGSDARPYYDKAIKTLVQMQNTPSQGLEPYDEAFLLQEMNLMTQWYLKEYLGTTLECVEGRILLESFSRICKEVLSQPQETFVHRDYHSRNLMIDEQEEVVVIDFQDAREGGLTYDLVSLLRDAYIQLDDRELRRLIALFKELKGVDVDDETFIRWFDFTGIQRHIKILGIFARLALRDGKTEYLKDIPMTLKYILNVGSKYSELDGLIHLLKSDNGKFKDAPIELSLF